MPPIRRLRRPACLAALLPLVLLALAAAPPAAAEVVAVGEPFPLAPDDPGAAVSGVDAAWLPPGQGADQPAGFLVAWRASTATRGTIDRAFIPEGSSSAAAQPLTVAGPGTVFDPSVAAGLDRRSAIVFGSGEAPACYGGFLFNTALVTQAALEPTAGRSCNQPFQDAAFLSDGRLLVVSESAVSFEVVNLEGQIFGPDGEAVGPAFPAGPGGELRRLQEVVAVPGGFFVFSVIAGGQGQFAASTLQVQRFDLQGQALSGPVDLRESPAVVTDVSVAAVGGGFVAVWAESSTSPGGTGIRRLLFGRRLDAAGQPVAPSEPLLAGVDPNLLLSPVVASGPGHSLILAWIERQSGAAMIRAQLLTADLAPAGERVTLALRPLGAFSLALAAGPAGDALAVWAEEGSAILAQRLAVETACTPSETVLCLQGGRFAVTVEWADFQGSSGPGHRVPVASDDSGLFWFFDPANWEMLVKVLDGCPVNGHFWVFSAAATNVEYTLTVNDLVAHETRVFRNDLGDTARALTATAAFPTCGAGGG